MVDGGFRSVVGVLVVLATLTGCAPPASTSAVPRPSLSAAASPVANKCPAIDLLTPRGERIDLSGSWAGGVTFHEARQEGSCMWWVGMSNWPGDDLGSAWLLTFDGLLSQDFTLTGEWREIFTNEFHGERRCPVSFDVTVEEVGGTEEVVLVNRNPGADIPCGYYAATMRRVDGPAS